MSRRYEIDTLNKIVIPSEARDLQFGTTCRSLSFGCAQGRDDKIWEC